MGRDRLAANAVDRPVWSGRELELEVDDVLIASTTPQQTPLPDGYSVRRLAGDDCEEDLAPIVRRGTTGRYQTVLTDANHRRRGLASHLLGVAARWAAAHGCDRWVIVTETTNAARSVYEHIGLEPRCTNVHAYRGRTAPEQRIDGR